MNELIVINYGKERYKEYEELLLRRDQLDRDAGAYLTLYTKEFGDMVTENFKLKVECIKIKKTISYCRRRMNRNLPINMDRMHDEIDKEMNLYYAQLHDMIKDTESAKKSKRATEYAARLAKKLYRKLAKILHPDINKMTMENDRLRELWERIREAYGKYDAEELDNLEALVGRVLGQLGAEGFEIDYSNIEERIERIERQINEIISTEPYIYGEILENEDKKTVYRTMLEEEYRDYERYLETLQKTLDDMLAEEGVKLVWKMS